MTAAGRTCAKPSLPPCSSIGYLGNLAFSSQTGSELGPHQESSSEIHSGGWAKQQFHCFLLRAVTTFYVLNSADHLLAWDDPRRPSVRASYSTRRSNQRPCSALKRPVQQRHYAESSKEADLRGGCDDRVGNLRSRLSENGIAIAISIFPGLAIDTGRIVLRLSPARIQEYGQGPCPTKAKILDDLGGAWLKRAAQTHPRHSEI